MTDRSGQPPQQPSPAQRPTAPLPPAAQTALARLERTLAPNPAAAALYTRAAADYETAAHDADRLGAHDRATAHRTRAQHNRALANQYQPAVNQ